MKTIYIINPNSSELVTAGIDRALDPLRIPEGPPFKALTLKEGPPGIQTQRDVDGVIGPLCRLVKDLDGSAAAFVIACFSDPGLHSVRETTAKPVLGIMESGILTALTLGQKFGVIAILAGSIPRHLRAIGAMGLTDRLAAEVPVGLPVVDLVDESKTFHRMVACGEQLRDQHGANSVVMGCAGMAQYRDRLQAVIGIPVVEPTQAAAAMAMGRVYLGW